MKSTSQKRILVVVESMDVEDSSGSKANVALIRNLKAAGYRLLVYHYTRKEIQLQNIPCVAIREKKWNVYYFLSRFQRKIQHGLTLNLAKYLEPRFGFSFTFLNDSKSISESLHQLKDFEPDLVLTLSKGASFRPHHALLQVPRFHNKWMAYIHDPYPFHFYPEPYNWDEPGYPHKIEFFKEIAIKCKWVAYPSLLLKEWMEQYFNDFKGKGLVIPHQLENVNYSKNPLPVYFNTNKFTVLHAGSLLKQRSPFGLIKGFQKFIDRNQDAQKNASLLLIGNNSYHFAALKKLQDKVPQLYVSEGYVPYNEVQLMQRNASINVILEAKADVSPFLPAKFPHCIAANKPILHLGPERSEVNRLLGIEYRYKAEVNNISRIAELLQELYDLWKSQNGSLRLNRKDLEIYLSAESLQAELDEILSLK